MSHLLHCIQPIDADSPESLRFERRRCPRFPVTGEATAMVSGGDPADVRGRICSVKLVNRSSTGLALAASHALPLGAQITVFLPPHGGERGYDLQGVVVRTSQRPWGHQIGIRLRNRAAA